MANKTKYTKVRGTQDIFGDNAKKFRRIIEVSQDLARQSNFEEIITPVIESANLFERNLGEESDAISKELYRFEDRGSNIIALRPEFTAGIARAVSENHELYRIAQSKLGLKLFSYGPLFRYDRPQKGRYRQFHQINFEYFYNDAENNQTMNILRTVMLIEIIETLFDTLGIQNYKLCINSLGSPSCIKRYENALKTYFFSYKDNLSKISKKRLAANPLRILDSKEPEDRLLVAGAPKIKDCYTQEECEYFIKTQEALSNKKLEFTVDENLVRGLDYYTGFIFEFIAEDGLTILGGGEYDNLVEQIGDISLKAVGCAGGVERLMDLLPKNSYVREPVLIFMVFEDSIQDPCLARRMNKCQELTRMPVELMLISPNKITAEKRKLAEIHNNCYVIVYGANEIKTGKIEIENIQNNCISKISLF